MSSQFDPTTGYPIDTSPGTTGGVAYDPITGAAVDTTPGTPGSGWGNPDTGFFSTIKDLFSGAGYGGQLGQLAAFGGLSTLLNKVAGQQSQQPVGYQGGIPQYTVSRQQLPYVSGAENEARRLKQATLDALSTGATLDDVAGAAQRTYGISPGQIDAAMRTEGAYRRPGLGGITYFSPTQYTATGQDLGRPTAGQVFGGGIANIVNPGVGGAVAPSGVPASGIQLAQPAATKPTTKYTDEQVASAIRESLRGGFDPQQTLNKAATLGATTDQLTRALAALQQSGYKNLVMPGSTTAAPAAVAPTRPAPRYTDEQVASAIRESLRNKFDPQQTLNKAAALGATADQLARAAAALNQSGYTGITSPAKFSDAQVASAIKTSLQEKYDPQEVLNRARDLGATTDQLERSVAALTESGYKGLKMPTEAPAAPKYTDEQVSSAIRQSLIDGFSAEATLKRAEELGATADQIVRARAALKESGYAGGGYMPGGIAMLAGGRYLRGPGDGVSDSIPAKFEQSGQPARLADGEFVIDARTVSEIGNGSSEAGARKLYAMMDRVHSARKKAQRGKPSGADKFLPK